jgi:hypothetical protein
MPVSRTGRLRSETQNENRAGIFPARFVSELLAKSGLALLRIRSFLALRFQLSELLG